jgi:Pyruvate/2-oxoacid:ferredoxin oxidoreductase delta subunit
MEHQDVYRELSKKLMMEHSTVLSEIWRELCSEEEARIVDRLPATIEDLAKTFEKTVIEMQGIINELYHRGVVFESVKDGITSYRMPRHIVQFHDATILWEESTLRLLELWREMTETEYPRLLELVTTAKLPSLVRVIPINETITAKNQVLAYEDAARMLQNARAIAVTKCPCRKLMKRCDGPLEACIQLDRGAEYAIKRGTGKKIDYDEAVAILKTCEEAGLVHMTENTAGRSNIICNCCSCCCEILRFATDVKTRGALAPSRFQAQVNAGECTSCSLCVDICPMDAIALNAEDLAWVSRDECIGCGLCASVCPVNAISLFEVRPKEFIPGK